MTHTRTFILWREEDATGISGVGPVADGVVFPDGTTVLRWRDVTGPNYDRGVRATTVVHESSESVEALHGHNGRTYIIWGASTATCKHCNRAIGCATFSNWVHLDGGQRSLARCNPKETGLPYGYNAHPRGTDCEPPCVGAPKDLDALERETDA